MLKNLRDKFGQLKDKSGYLSIETVIVAGIIIALGAWAFTAFYEVANEQVGMSLFRIEEVNYVEVRMTPIP